VKEIEALGGFMGRAADACAIHGRNLEPQQGAGGAGDAGAGRQGPLRGARTSALLADPRVRVVGGLVAGLLFEGTGRVRGVSLQDGSEIAGRRWC
jgi:tRNA uridine 5-carboxymethylaminomethyl modification enzyme